MKNWIRLTGLALIGVMGMSCAPTYDSYGNTRQTVSPAGIAVGAVALGALAYSVGRSSGKRSERRRHDNHHRPVNPGWGYGGHRGGNYYR